MKGTARILDSMPFFLLLLIAAAFGGLIPWLGFYWDDWIWMYFSHQYGPESLLYIDRLARPFSGELLYIGAAVLGENPLAWYLWSLVLRFFTALALWWTLRQLWPEFLMIMISTGAPAASAFSLYCSNSL